MSDQARDKDPRRTRLRAIGWLLAVWSDWRRPILLVLITAALVSFFSSLSLETRRALVAGAFAQRSLVLLLLFFSLLTLSLLWSAGQRLDAWIFQLLNVRGPHPLWLDRVMWIFTQIGNGLFGLLLVTALYFTGERRLAAELLLGILSLWLAVELVKVLVERHRPFLALETTRIIGWRERGKSFPSGHTSQAFLMMVILSRNLGGNALATAVLFLTAVMVGLTRIYVGAHYPRDVLAGAFLGSVWGIALGLVEAYLRTGTF